MEPGPAGEGPRRHRQRGTTEVPEAGRCQTGVAPAECWTVERMKAAAASLCAREAWCEGAGEQNAVGGASTVFLSGLVLASRGIPRPRRPWQGCSRESAASLLLTDREAVTWEHCYARIHTQSASLISVRGAGSRAGA